MKFDLNEFPQFLRSFGLLLLAGGILHGAFEMWSVEVYTLVVIGGLSIVASFIRRQ